MTEYYRDPENRIRADFALRAGRLLSQYLSVSGSFAPSQRYEATLTICVLQALLTQCTELIKEMSAEDRSEWRQTVTDVPTRWGLRRGFVKEDTWPEPLTYERFLTSLRNACSHPTGASQTSFPASTGYTTIPGPTGKVEAFEFVDSPSVQKGTIQRPFISKNKEDVEIQCQKSTADWNKHNPHSEAFFEVVRVRDRYQLFKEGQPYIRLLRVKIGLTELTGIVSFVANYLAQPTQEFWDGKTVSPLVA